MSEAFDPYHKWLGIRPSERPLDFYRLLGVARFESDLDVISNAADQRMTHVRAFRKSAHAELAEKILKELSAARVSLLDAEKKRVYDERLRATLAKKQAQQPKPPTAQPLAEPPAAGAASKSDARPAKRRGKDAAATSFWKTPAGIAVLIVVPMLAAFLLVAVVGAVIFMGGRFIAGGDDNSAILRDLGEPLHGHKPREPAQPVDRTATPAGDTSPAAERAAGDENGPADPDASPSEGSPGAAEADRTNPVAGPVDVNPSGSPEAAGSQSTPAANDRTLWRHAQGFFRKTNSGWIEQSPNGDFTFRESGSTDTYLDLIDERRGIAVRLYDDRCYLRRSADPDWRLFYRGAWSRDVASAESGSPPATAEPDDQEGRVVVRTGPPVDLLALIDPSEHRIRGEFTKDATGALLTSPDDAPGLLHIPHEPPQAYWLSAEVTRLSGSDELIFGLVVGGRQANFDLDGWERKGNLSGLGMIDGKRADYPGYDSAYVGTVLRNGRTSEINILVKRDRVIFECDGETIQDWQGDAERLTPFWRAPTLTDLFLGSYRSAYRISRLEIREVTGTRMAEEEGVTRPGKPDLADASDPYAPPPPPREPSVERRALPSEEERLKAGREVRELFADKLENAKNSESRVALSRELLDLASDTQDDPTAFYALLEQARVVAAKAGDVRLALECVQQLVRKFETDERSLRIETLTECAGNAQLPAEREAVARAAYDSSRKAAADEDFEAADKLSRMALASATRGRDVELRKRLLDWQKDLVKAKAASQKAQQARRRLEENPQDAAAHLTLGKYLCTIKEDWTEAIEHLAAGDDELIAAAANLDATRPRNSKAQVMVGDAWWDALEEVKEPHLTAFRRRCLMWYDEGCFGLSGLNQTRVRKRIAELRKLIPKGTPPLFISPEG